MDFFRFHIELLDQMNHFDHDWASVLIVLFI